MSGHGTVMSWAQSVHPRPYGFAEPPIAALIELEEGPRLVATLEGVKVPPAPPSDGVTVTVPVTVPLGTAHSQV